MKRIDTSRLSHNECWGVQINGLSHCRIINCRWQGLSACVGKNIIRTGFNSKGYKVGEFGMEIDVEKPARIKMKQKNPPH